MVTLVERSCEFSGRRFGSVWRESCQLLVLKPEVILLVWRFRARYFGQVELFVFKVVCRRVRGKWSLVDRLLDGVRLVCDPLAHLHLFVFDYFLLNLGGVVQV